MGALPDLDVCSPGATVALGLGYLRTNDWHAASKLEIPCTDYQLTTIRPDLALLRATARCLILWDQVGSSSTWLHSQMPPLLRGSLRSLVHRWADLPLGECQARVAAHVSLLSGFCLGMGLKFAGSQDRNAANTLRAAAEELLR